MKFERNKKTYGRSITISYSPLELEKDLGYRLSKLERKVTQLESLIQKLLSLPVCGSCEFCVTISDKIKSVYVCKHPDNLSSDKNVYMEVSPLQYACDKFVRRNL